MDGDEQDKHMSDNRRKTNRVLNPRSSFSISMRGLIALRTGANQEEAEAEESAEDFDDLSDSSFSSFDEDFEYYGQFVTRKLREPTKLKNIGDDDYEESEEEIENEGTIGWAKKVSEFGSTPPDPDYDATSGKNIKTHPKYLRR